MTKPTQAQIEAAADAIRQEFNKSAPLISFVEVAQIALTAAAQVGEQDRLKSVETAYVASDEIERLNDKLAATIERCKQVVRRYAINIGEIAETIALEIESLKDKP